MNAMTPDPAAVLARLHAETKVARDAKPPSDSAADVLNSRVCAIQDVLFTLPTDDPAALRIQADAIRVFTADFQHDSREAAIMELAATYAERLATVLTTLPAAPPSPDQTTALRLADTTMHMLDALGALRLAITGIEDAADCRSLLFVHDKAAEIAGEVDELARALHHGGAS